MLKLSVIVPTYRRPQDLRRCLLALAKQTRQPQQVIVVVRDNDAETWDLLSDFDTNLLPFEALTVKVTGVVAAMNLGLEHAEGDILAFTDDDSAPHADWLAKIEAHFEFDAAIAGVGGRDVLQHPAPYELGTREVVGKLQWHGRVIGQHHRGIGPVREVDVLKGVNMSFRFSALGDLKFDHRMRGTGAQVHFELAFCFSLKRKGWKLIYDPQLLVDHYIAPRHDEDQRNQFNKVAFSNAVHNETLALLEQLSSLQYPIFLIWCMGVGTTRAFGVIQWIRYLPLEGSLSTQKWIASIQGRYQGWRTWLHYQSMS